MGILERWTEPECPFAELADYCIRLIQGEVRPRARIAKALSVNRPQQAPLSRRERQIISLQAIWRGQRVRRAIRKQRHAAVVIQRGYRRWRRAHAKRQERARKAREESHRARLKTIDRVLHLREARVDELSEVPAGRFMSALEEERREVCGLGCPGTGWHVIVAEHMGAGRQFRV